MLTGEDQITADRKFKDPISFINYAKLLFSANELPYSKDQTDAFYRRWILIEFPNKFDVDPTFYERTFPDEYEGIIVVALHAFKRVWLNKRFSFEETEADYKEQWLRNVDSIYAFVKIGQEEGWLEIAKDAEDSFENLYEAYKAFCDSEGRKPSPRNIFSMRLVEFGFRRKRYKNKVYFEGIRVKREDEDWQGLDSYAWS